MHIDKRGYSGEDAEVVHLCEVDSKRLFDRVILSDFKVDNPIQCAIIKKHAYYETQTLLDIVSIRPPDRVKDYVSKLVETYLALPKFYMNTGITMDSFITMSMEEIDIVVEKYIQSLEDKGRDDEVVDNIT